MKQKTKNYTLFSVGFTALVVAVFSMAYLTANAANRFTFSGQGIVSENNVNEKYIRVSLKQITKRAESLVSGGPVTIRVNNAKVYKPNAAGTLLQLHQENIDTEVMVTVFGSVKSDNSLSASKVTIVPRKFKIRGRLMDINRDTNSMNIDVSASNYKPTKFVGEKVNVHFSERLLVFHSGGTKDVKKLEPLNQRVVVDGIITGDDKFEAIQMTDPL